MPHFTEEYVGTVESYLVSLIEEITPLCQGKPLNCAEILCYLHSEFHGLLIDIAVAPPPLPPHNGQFSISPMKNRI